MVVVVVVLVVVKEKKNKNRKKTKKTQKHPHVPPSDLDGFSNEGPTATLGHGVHQHVLQLVYVTITRLAASCRTVAWSDSLKTEQV